MRFGKALVKAKRIGVRRFRNNLSKIVKKHEMFVVTDHGTPASVLLPYDDILEIIDILDELRDKVALNAVALGRKSIAARTKGILASKILKKS